MTGQQVGYIRVSSMDQNPQRQLEGVALDRVFTDKASAKDTDRPQLKALLQFVRAGDTLVVHSMDRLARNLEDLRKIVQQQTTRGVHVEFVKEGLTFSGEDSPMAHLMLSVMGAFAEFERGLAAGESALQCSRRVPDISGRYPLTRTLIPSVANLAQPLRLYKLALMSHGAPALRPTRDQGESRLLRLPIPYSIEYRRKHRAVEGS